MWALRSNGIGEHPGGFFVKKPGPHHAHFVSSAMIGDRLNRARRAHSAKLVIPDSAFNFIWRMMGMAFGGLFLGSPAPSLSVGYPFSCFG